MLRTLATFKPGEYHKRSRAQSGLHSHAQSRFPNELVGNIFMPKLSHKLQN